jgi:long-chain acyl-CoA synthetase
MADKPWLAHYDADVPASLYPYPEKTLLDYLDTLASEHPSRPALLFKGAEVSYDELQRQSNAFAAALAALGVRHGDRIALILPNCPQFLVAEIGAWKVGAVVCPINPTYTEREMEAALQANTAETVVTLTPFYGRIKDVQPRTALRNVIATSIKEHLPPALRLLFTLFKEKQGGHRISLQTGRLLAAGSAATASEFLSASGCRPARRSSRYPGKRRYDRHTERGRRTPPPLCGRRPPAL